MEPFRVLVVDDNIDVADSLALLVRLWGYDTTTAYNGPSAVRVAGPLQPQVAILDVGMPGMDGNELARRLKDEVDGVFLIAFSGYSASSTADSLFDLHFLKGKPLEELRAVLAKLSRKANGAQVAVV